MGTFVKTFIICLIATLAFLFYKVVGNNSYSPDLAIKKGEIFGSSKIQDEKKEENKENIENEPKQEEAKTQIQKEEKAPIETVQKKETYKSVCYFYSKNGQLVQITKEMNTKPKLEGVISMLLKGPTIQDSKKGIYSEIPTGVDLISIKKQNNKITLNLTQNFANDSSFQSVENRLKQLTKTIRYYEPKAQIYLLIDGNMVEYLGGDGVYIKQPLEY